MTKKFKIIGLTGTNGSGKGEAALFFQENGFAFLSLSDLIRDELKKKNQDLSRDNLIREGNSLRESFGPDILARMALDKVRGKTVIDSIRNPKEVETLKTQEGFILLSIDAPVEIRFERVRKRGRQESAETLEEFINKEKEEMSSEDKDQQLHTCMEMSDFAIINDGSLEDFRRKLEEFL